MKKIIISIALILITSQMYGQIHVNSKFKARSYQDYYNPVYAAQRAHEALDQEITSTMDYVSEILTQNIDAEMRRTMTSEFSVLSNLYEQLYKYGISPELSSAYKTVAARIKREVVEYNNRLAQSRQNAYGHYPADGANGNSGSGTISQKERYVSVGEKVSACLSGIGDVTEWKVNNQYKDSCCISGKTIEFKNPGVYNVWGLINETPYLFTFTVL